MLMSVYNIVHVLLRTLYTYSVGFSVVVWNERQYQSLCKRNSNIAVPLLLCVYTTQTSKHANLKDDNKYKST